MSSRPHEGERLRRLLRRPPPIAPPPATPSAVSPATTLPQLPTEEVTAARIGRITSLFHRMRLGPTEVAIHPNRLGEIPQDLDAIVIDASAALAASVWAGLGLPGGGRVTAAALELIGAGKTPVVFRWDIGGVSPIRHLLSDLAGACDGVVAAPGGPRHYEDRIVPFGVATELLAGRGRHRHGLGMLAPGALAGWTDPITDDSPPDHAETVDARVIGDPAAFGEWLGGIRMLALPQPITPLIYQLGAEAVAAGTLLDDGLVVETASHDKALRLLHSALGAT